MSRDKVLSRSESLIDVPLHPYTSVNDIDFDPREVVGRYPRKVLGAIGTFAGTLALTAGLSAGLATLSDLGDAGTLHREQTELAHRLDQHDQRLELRQNNALEADENLDRLQLNLGEGCVSLIETYMSGRPLAGTPENVIVSDISNNEAKPCGDNPTQVRTAVTGLFTAEARAYSTGQSLDEEQNTVIDTDLSLFEKDAETQEWPKGIAIGGAMGVVFGALAARSWVKWANHYLFAKRQLSNYLYTRMKKRSWSTYVTFKDSGELAEKIIDKRLPELADKADRK